MRAVLYVPLIEEGRLAAVLLVNHAAPYIWNDNEVLLAKAAAARTWAAIGRAQEKATLAAWERQLQSTIKAADLAVWELDLTTDKVVRSLRHD